MQNPNKNALTDELTKFNIQIPPLNSERQSRQELARSVIEAKPFEIRANFNSERENKGFDSYQNCIIQCQK